METTEFYFSSESVDAVQNIPDATDVVVPGAGEMVIEAIPEHAIQQLEMEPTIHIGENDIQLLVSDGNLDLGDMTFFRDIAGEGPSEIQLIVVDSLESARDFLEKNDVISEEQCNIDSQNEMESNIEQPVQIPSDTDQNPSEEANLFPVQNSGGTEGHSDVFHAVPLPPFRRVPANKILPQQIGKYRQGMKKIYACHLCQNIYCSKHALNEHMNLHTGRMPYMCCICGMHFMYQSALYYHSKKCTRKTYYRKSRQEYFTPSSSHVSEEPLNIKDMPFICPTCSERFVAAEDLKLHFRNHKGKKPYVCRLCSKNFALGLDLSVHLQQCHGEKAMYVCSHCSWNFADEATLQSHMRTHVKPKPIRSFSCPYCRLSFRLNIQLKHHIRSHQEADHSPKSSPSAGGPVPQPQNTNQHATPKDSKLHLQTRPKEASAVSPLSEQSLATCKECGEQYSNSDTFQDHLRLHVGPKRHSCGKCGNKFWTHCALKLHIQEHVLEEKSNQTIADGEVPPDSDMGVTELHLTSIATIPTHTCELCGLQFPEANGLRIHLRSHTGREPFVCKYCNRHFTMSSTLTIHMRIHSGENPLNCEYCCRTFPDTECLKAHVETKHAGRISHVNEQHQEYREVPVENKCEEVPKESARHYKCKYCGRDFVRISSLKVHLKSHRGEKPYPCNQCHLRFSHRASLDAHTVQHSRENPFSCSFCQKSFPSSSALTVHQTIHAGVENFSCGDCNAHFPDIVAFEMHVKESHTGKEPLICENCGGTFIHRTDLDFHLCPNQNHQSHDFNNGKPILENSETGGDEASAKTSSEKSSCPTCGRSFVSAFALRMHSRTHSSRKPFACKYCGRNFSQQANLRAHERTHTGEKPFVCEVCNKRFAHSCNLKSHMDTHNEEKSYICEFCNKAFTQYKVLITHFRTHTGEKPYACNYCDQCFTQSAHLVHHIRTHTGERPYSCKICGQGFSQSGTLRSHMRTHTGEKPFACQYCFQSFAQKGALRVHVRIHTGEKPYMCKYCRHRFTQHCALRSHLMRYHS